MRCKYLVADVTAALISDALDKEDGSGRIINIHQGFNFDTTCAYLGVVVEQSTLIISEVSTLGDSPRAKEIQKLFRKVIMKHTKKVGNTRVMPGAMEKLKAGWVLVPGLDMPKHYQVQLAE
jgi:hypothetical protein